MQPLVYLLAKDFEPEIRRKALFASMVRIDRIYLDRTVRSMLISELSDACAAGFWLRVHRDIVMGRPVMAAARDQAARIVRAEPDTAEGGSLRATAGRPLADQLRTHVAEETVRAAGRRRRTQPAIDTAGAPQPLPPIRGAEIRQAQIRVDGHRSRLLALAAVRLRRLLSFWSGASTSRPTTPMCAPTTPRSAPGCRAISRQSFPATTSIVRAGDVIFRIDDGDYRIAVDAARSKIATQQATIDRIGRQVTALESAVEQAKAQLASAEAALEARRPRLRAPAGAEHQGILPRARHLRFPKPAAIRAWRRSNRRRRPMTPRATMSR